MEISFSLLARPTRVPGYSRFRCFRPIARADLVRFRTFDSTSAQRLSLAVLSRLPFISVK